MYADWKIFDSLAAWSPADYHFVSVKFYAESNLKEVILSQYIFLLSIKHIHQFRKDSNCKLQLG